MTDPALTLGTAGHIDHGKTALVRALTGVDTDRLPQERERGISIELGFARMDLPSGRWLSVVDVPGHERFVRTMVAGATGIDLFLLVVAADDGVMPQTREHLAVLEQLEVPGGVVALTKADVAGAEELALAQAEVEELLAAGPFAGAPVVSVSAARGTGLDELRERLENAARAAPDRARLGGPARLHVDRSFTLQGIGTVVTGTLWSGSIARGEEVRIEPGGARARVRGVEVHAESRARADAGQRVALNLAGIERSEVERGDVVVDGDAAPAAGYLLDVELSLLAGTRPLARGARVHVHHGTRETAARVSPVEGERLEPGEAGLAQLRLERPLVAVAGDRFVIRALAPPDTIGGGRVLDASPRKHGPGEEHVVRLGALRSGDPLEVLRLEIEAARSGLEAPDRSEELARLAGTGAAVPVGGPRGAVVHTRAARRSARRFDAPPPARTRARAPRRRLRTAPGWTPVERPRCWRRWPPRVTSNAVVGATCAPGRRPRPTRSTRSCCTHWSATACSPGRSWHLPRARGWRRRRRVRPSTAWWPAARSCGRSRASTTTRMPLSERGRRWWGCASRRGP